MSELSELSNESFIPLHQKENPDPLLEARIVRNSDSATIKPLDSNIELNVSPHNIGESYVTEGFFFTAEVERPQYLRNGRFNDKGLGQASTETKVERTRLILAMSSENGGPWLDAKPFLCAADGMKLAERTVQFSQFSEFQGCIDKDTIRAVLDPTEMERYEPKRIFKAVRDEIERLLELEPSASTIMALWAVLTYVHDAFDAFPYLWFNGVKGSGKTRALEILEQVTYHGEMNMRLSNSALFRLVADNHITVCYDEAENLLVRSQNRSEDQDRVSLFNGGYRSSGAVRLTEKDGDNFIIRRFQSYSPKALASIQPLDEALQSRCILISMMTALDASKANKGINLGKCEAIRRELYKFRFNQGPHMKVLSSDEARNEELRAKYDLKNRDWELFKPLVIGAEIFCPDWVEEVVRFIAHQKILRQVENQTTRDATILQTLIQVAVEAENAPDDAHTIVSYKEFTAMLKEEADLKLTPKALGHCLRRLGLGGLITRHGRGFIIQLDKEHFIRQAQRLGMADATVVAEPQAGLDKFSGGGQ